MSQILPFPLHRRRAVTREDAMRVYRRLEREHGRFTLRGWVCAQERMEGVRRG